jgi:hypothetical protein
MDNAIMQDAEPIRFERVRLDATWRRPVSFAFVSELGQIPISDSELLLSSHYLPIAIEHVDDGLQVVAITRPQFHRAPLIDANGGWLRSYAPLALRCLPFRAVSGNSDALEIAPNLGQPAGPPLPLSSVDGAPTREIEQIMKLLRRLEAGKRRLQAAAEKLLIADVLAPFQLARLPGIAAISSRALTVDRNKFAALSSRRAAHIAKDDFLAIDLATACLFSQRLTPSLISIATEPKNSTEAGKNEEYSLDFRPSTQLDDTELFSFELFSGTKPAK